MLNFGNGDIDWVLSTGYWVMEGTLTRSILCVSFTKNLDPRLMLKLVHYVLCTVNYTKSIGKDEHCVKRAGYIDSKIKV